MQDIIPPRPSSRGSLRAPERAVPYANRPAASYRTTQTRQIKMVNDILPYQNTTTITETVTSTYESAVLEPVAGVTLNALDKRTEHLSPVAKSDALQHALLKSVKELKKERRKQKDLKRFGLILVASMFVLVTGYVSIDTWMTNNRVKAETSQAKTASDGASWAPEEEGQDETKPSEVTLANYAVSPQLPRKLYIDKLGIHARVLPMSVGRDGAVQAPRNIFDAGWYNGSVKPGEIGAVFIDGHASGPTREGLFAYLDTLAQGDEIQIEKGDGSRLTYRVVTTKTVPLADLNMKDILLPQDGVLRGLNLMTCTGKWIESKKTFDHRVLVWAEQV